MYAWCVGELGMSEDVASKRIQAARLARRCPAMFAMLADGRLNLSAVVLLAPHLTPETADQLLAAATRQTGPSSRGCWPRASRARTCRPACGPWRRSCRPAS
jgi:hypothetical protein